MQPEIGASATRLFTSEDHVDENGSSETRNLVPGVEVRRGVTAIPVGLEDFVHPLGAKAVSAVQEQFCC